MDDPINVQQPSQPAPTSPTSPTSQPNPSQPQDKDKFSKVMNRDKDDDEKGGAVVSSLEESSIFALSRGAGTKKKKEVSEEGKNVSTGQTRADLSGILAPTDDMSSGDTDEDGKNKNSNTMDLSSETRKDIFQFISNATQVQGTNFSEMVGGAALSTQDAVDVASQIEKMMIQMQSNGDKTTTVTLNRPGIFDGAIVNVQQFGTAPGQFNLSFENLTNQAKMMMDLKTSRDTLMQTLQEKGYNVHIVITTTEIERPEYQQELNPQQDQQQQQGQGQQQQGQQQ